MSKTSDHLVGILADDLTSAADGAGPFLGSGLRAVVGRHAIPTVPSPVTAVDSGTRSLDVERAAARVSVLARQLAGHAIFYKTMDSTLRGHVQAEIEGSFGPSRRRRLVIAPAFPDAGRTTVNGVQLVNGIPVSETVYGRDPVHPAHTSIVTQLVPRSLDNVMLINASTQQELDEQVAAIKDPESVMWVGSPGMAIALARRLGLGLGADALPAPGMTCARILVAVGSANPVSHRQVSLVKQIDQVELLVAPAERQQEPVAVLRTIAHKACERIRENDFGALIATGGDTMEAILDLLNVQEFEVLSELEPGFPLGRATLANGSPLLIAMKAGGFGEEATILQSIARLRRLHQ